MLKNKDEYYVLMFLVMKQAKQIYHNTIKEIGVYPDFASFYFYMKRYLWFKWDDGMMNEDFEYWGVDIQRVNKKIEEIKCIRDTKILNQKKLMGE